MMGSTTAVASGEVMAHARTAAVLLLAFAHAAVRADASAPSPKIDAAIEGMRRHRTCGTCIAAGGAWCLATEPPRCVPDARGLCGAGGPEDHVGWAGFGRCPGAADWELQTYLHAPRRPPPLVLQQPADPDCVASCAATTAFQLADLTQTPQAFERCGFAVVSELFDPLALAELRDELVRRQNLTLGMRAGHKLEMPGVRGSNRQELVLPFRHAPTLLPALGRPASIRMLTQLLGHPPAIDFASIVVAWPGADAQDFHRDADAGMEAALLIFVPLDPTSATTQTGASGPPELCPCTHVPGSVEACEVNGRPTDALPMATDDRVPLGSAVVYDSGLVHRGAVNPPSRAGSAEVSHDPLFGDSNDGTSARADGPRLMLSIAIAPRSGGLRGRPEAFLGAAAKAHVERWRSVVLGADEQSPAYGCSLHADCASCLAAGRSAESEGADGSLPWRTGCAWCASGDGGWAANTGAGECVPDVAGRCNSADEHYGESGMNAPQCPTDHATSDDDGEYEEL